MLKILTTLSQLESNLLVQDMEDRHLLGLVEVCSSGLQFIPRKQHHNGSGERAYGKALDSDHGGCPKRDVRNIPRVGDQSGSHDWKGNYEVTPKSAVFKSLEPDNNFDNIAVRNVPSRALVRNILLPRISKILGMQDEFQVVTHAWNS